MPFLSTNPLAIGIPPLVTKMGSVFTNAMPEAFDQDISLGDTSKVTNMGGAGSMSSRRPGLWRKFNQPIGNWDTSDSFFWQSRCPWLSTRFGDWEPSIQPCPGNTHGV